MDSWVSGRSFGEPDPVSSSGDLHAAPLPAGEAAVPAAGRPSPVPLRDGSSPLRISFTGSPPTVRLNGDIDEWTYPDLTGVLTQVASAAERQVRIDLADVKYCDVAGLRAPGGRGPPGRATGNPWL